MGHKPIHTSKGLHMDMGILSARSCEKVEKDSKCKADDKKEAFMTFSTVRPIEVVHGG